jgi:hypothetical protein
VSAGDVVGLVLAVLALAVSVVALLVARRSALSAEAAARRARGHAERAEAIEGQRDPALRARAAEFDRQAIAAMRERADRERRERRGEE